MEENLDLNKFVKFKEGIHKNIEKVIVGKKDKIDKILVAFICGGHVLLDDVPGTGKTKLSKSLAKSLSCSFKRIQFTPDLMPSDLTGVYYYNQKNSEFEFKKGPLFSQFVLADEINRATPRTQAALLECMEEKQVTVEGDTKKLERPFFVIATQNPVEQFGTFPLPEAQLDRFFIKISLGYPEYMEEKDILNMYIKNDPLEKISEVMSLDDIKYVQTNYVNVEVGEDIKNYVLDIVTMTRSYSNVELGASPRATLMLMKGAQAYAAINGRDYVIPEDVKTMAGPVLNHRIVLKPHINSNEEKPEEIVEQILNSVRVPLEKL